MSKGNPANDILIQLETELGEPLLYRGTGHFVAASGLDAPLEDWGLIGLTPTRLIYRHFAQAHPLLGGKGQERRWETPLAVFEHCAAVRQPWWRKLLSSLPDHIAVGGPGAHLAIELADDLNAFVEAWPLAVPLDPVPPPNS